MSNPTHDPPTKWVVSDHSGNDGTQTDCVKVGYGEEGVYVHDSKDFDGGSVRLGVEGWQAFLEAVDAAGFGPVQ